MVTWVKEKGPTEPRARALSEELAAAFAKKGTRALSQGKRRLDKKSQDLKTQRKDRSVRVIHE